MMKKIFSATWKKKFRWEFWKEKKVFLCNNYFLTFLIQLKEFAIKFQEKKFENSFEWKNLFLERFLFELILINLEKY